MFSANYIGEVIYETFSSENVSQKVVKKKLQKKNGAWA